MDARVRQKYEVPVVAPESKALDELKADVRELRAADAALATKIDAVGAKVDAIYVSLRDKIEAVQAALGNRIDAVQTSLCARMDEGFRASNARHDKLDERLSNLSDEFASLRGFLKTILWLTGAIVSSASVATAVISIGTNLHWF